MEYAFEHPTGELLVATAGKIFDGDGFMAKLRLPWPLRLLKKQSPEIAVRLGFVDAPEIDQAGGAEAQRFLSELVLEKELALSILLKSDTNSSFDAYKRLVCVPYVRDNRHEIGWRNVEVEILLNGWGWLLERYCPPDHYYDAVEHAQSLRRGVWADDSPMSPWEFKRRKRRNRSRPVSRQLEFADICPQSGCGGKLQRKNGRFGPFYGCSNYPRCKFTRNAN